MEEDAKLILKDSLIIEMLLSAKLDYGIEEEVSFALAVAHLDGLLLPKKKFDKVFLFFKYLKNLFYSI